MKTLKDKAEYPLSDCSCKDSLGFSDYYMELQKRWYTTNWRVSLSDEDVKIMIASGALDGMQEEKTKENITKWINGSLNLKLINTRLNFCGLSLWKFLKEYCKVNNVSHVCKKCNGNGGLSCYYYKADLAEAVNKFENRLLELDPNGTKEFHSYEILKLHKGIFGEFTKEEEDE